MRGPDLASFDSQQPLATQSSRPTLSLPPGTLSSPTRSQRDHHRPVQPSKYALPTQFRTVRCMIPSPLLPAPLSQLRPPANRIARARFWRLHAPEERQTALHMWSSPNTIRIEMSCPSPVDDLDHRAIHRQQELKMSFRAYNSIVWRCSYVL